MGPTDRAAIRTQTTRTGGPEADQGQARSARLGEAPARRGAQEAAAEPLAGAAQSRAGGRRRASGAPTAKLKLELPLERPRRRGRTPLGLVEGGPEAVWQKVQLNR